MWNPTNKQPLQSNPSPPPSITQEVSPRAAKGNNSTKSATATTSTRLSPLRQPSTEPTTTTAANNRLGHLRSPSMESVLSSPDSLTSRSMEDMEMDKLSVVGGSPPRRASPLHDHPNHNEIISPLSPEIEKGIVVDAPLSANAMVVDDEDDYEDEEPTSNSHKRKRTSVNYILDGLEDSPARTRSSPVEPRAKRRTGPKVRGVIIGVWRDSDQPDDAEKHVIFGFIDIHDRLRTRIYSMNRRGEELIGNAPTGAGGCWVTFERVIFEPHLRALNAAQIKEYVKIRSEAKPEETPEEREEAQDKAVLKAIATASDDASTPSGSKPPARRSLGGSTRIREPRESTPRQSLHKAPSFQAVNAADMQTPKASPFAEGKPHGVLLGYWADSDESRVEDKHAVFGVVSETDCFRVKVQRMSRDGRHIDGNYPIGAGAMWLSYDKVVLDDHIAHLSRPQVKEYCRIRQKQQDSGETEKEKRINEQRAIREVVTTITSTKPAASEPAEPTAGVETRQSLRSEQKLLAQQQAETEAAAAARARQEKIEATERRNEKTRKEVAAAEALIQETAQQQLKKNLQRLNKVWVAQQAAQSPNHNRSPAATPAPAPPVDNDIKYHHGIKYETKATGPFQGKLVSAAQILTIDGEDFVEYRVLTRIT